MATALERRRAIWGEAFAPVIVSAAILQAILDALGELLEW